LACQSAFCWLPPLLAAQPVPVLLAGLVGFQLLLLFAAAAGLDLLSAGFPLGQLAVLLLLLLLLGLGWGGRGRGGWGGDL